MKYKFLREGEKDFFKGKRVLVRVGINVPLENNKIENDFRLKAILPTIKFLIEAKAKIILLGHLGRKKENNLKIIFQWLKKNIGDEKVFFNSETFKSENFEKIEEKISEAVSKISSGEILLLDNVRATAGEKNNSEDLAKIIAENFDIYVNEAFSVSHRKHMSMDALLVQFSGENRFYGLRFEEELKILEKIKNPQNFKKKIFILGGAKIATKIPMLKNLINKFDSIILGGAVANNFYLKMGYSIGNSFYDKDFIFEEKEFKEMMESGKIFLPNIVITQNGEKNISEILSEDEILDISSKSFKKVEKELKEADFVFFNGPLGYYEGGYEEGTKYLLNILANPNNFFVAGGGNTSSIIFELGLEKNVDFISTGGGALIEAISE